jgi:hypothetical protein
MWAITGCEQSQQGDPSLDYLVGAGEQARLVSSGSSSCARGDAFGGDENKPCDADFATRYSPRQLLAKVHEYLTVDAPTR